MLISMCVPTLPTEYWASSFGTACIILIKRLSRLQYKAITLFLQTLNRLHMEEGWLRLVTHINTPPHTHTIEHTSLHLQQYCLCERVRTHPRRGHTMRKCYWIIQNPEKCLSKTEGEFRRRLQTGFIEKETHRHREREKEKEKEGEVKSMSQ